jgi:recombinase, phage RecT family
MGELTVTQKWVKSAQNLLMEQMTQGLSTRSGYDIQGALSYAILKMQNDNILDSVQPETVVQALLQTAYMGLDPRQNQVYYINYGGKLQVQPSYFGKIAQLKELPEIKSIKTEVVREGEEFNFDDFEITHKRTLETLDNSIIAAYAIIETNDGNKSIEVMSAKQINQSWAQSKSKKLNFTNHGEKYLVPVNDVQAKFPDQMAKRTVISRAAKFVINTSKNPSVAEVENEESGNGVRDVTPVDDELVLEEAVKTGNVIKSSETSDTELEHQDDTNTSEVVNEPVDLDLGGL